MGNRDEKWEVEGQCEGERSIHAENLLLECTVYTKVHVAGLGEPLKVNCNFLLREYIIVLHVLILWYLEARPLTPMEIE